MADTDDTADSGFSHLRLEHFEQAWRDGPVPQLDAFLDPVPQGASRQMLVMGLIRIDLEYRWKRFTDSTGTTLDSPPDRPFVVADYVSRFPELTDDDSAIEELLVEEHRVRQRWGDRPSDEEFLHQNSSVMTEALKQRVVQSLRTSDTVIPAETSAEADVGFRRIGPYRILRKIGAGGMGEVYLAKQEEPIRRSVALKVIRSGADSEQIIARFESERQALAMMEHPNIARILDGGTTDNGSPYFVMELVQGSPLTEYCNANSLSITKRLELFVSVCRAVQHAHVKGIVHRDLKPSNVLVAMHDGVPVPKVIDFGLAKATQHQIRLSGESVFTELGQVVGTLQYMSPEQASLDDSDVDTRTDIYSLGIMLYELLTGSTPLDRMTLGQNAFLRILELIRDTDPVRPSHRLSRSGDELTEVSRQRRIQPSKLQNVLRGELDWVVMKALEKDRQRRYETADGFATDVLRFLSHEPVLARPPSGTYRFRKFIRKHRGLVTAGVLVASVLLLGIMSATLLWMSAENARDSAEKSEKRSRDVLQIVVESFNSADPNLTGSSGMSARDVLLSAYKSTRDSSLDQSGRMLLLRTLNTCFVGVGELDSAMTAGEETVQLASELFGADHLETLDAMHNLAATYSAAGRIADALQLNEHVAARRTEKLGETDPATLRTLRNLADGYQDAGRIADSLTLIQHVLDVSQKTLGEEHPDTLMTKLNLAGIYEAEDRFDDALQVYQNLQPLMVKSFGADDATTLRFMVDFGDCYVDAGQFDTALKLNLETHPLIVSRFGADHHSTLISMGNLAKSYSMAGNNTESLRIFQEALELCSKSLGAAHPTTLHAINDLATNYSMIDRKADALQLYEKALTLRSANLGSDHPDTLRSMGDVAAALSNSGQQMDRALLLFDTAYLGMYRKFSSDHPDVRLFADNLEITLIRSLESAANLTASEDYATAEVLLKAMADHYGPHKSLVRNVPVQLCHALLSQDKFEEVAEAALVSDTQLESHQQSVRSDAASALASRAVSLLQLNEYEDAIAAAERALAVADIHALDRSRCFSVLSADCARRKSPKEANDFAVRALEDMQTALDDMPFYARPSASRTCARLINVRELCRNDASFSVTLESLTRLQQMIDAVPVLVFSFEEAFAISERIQESAVSNRVISAREMSEIRVICDVYPSWAFFGPLAISEFRMNNFEAAISATMCCIDSQSDQASFTRPDLSDLAVLAMSHFRLGNIKRARELRDQFNEAFESESADEMTIWPPLLDEVNAFFEADEFQ